MWLNASHGAVDLVQVLVEVSPRSLVVDWVEGTMSFVEMMRSSCPVVQCVTMVLETADQ